MPPNTLIGSPSKCAMVSPRGPIVSRYSFGDMSACSVEVNNVDGVRFLKVGVLNLKNPDHVKVLSQLA